MAVVASLPQGRTAAAQCGLFTHKSVPVIFEPPRIYNLILNGSTATVDLDILIVEVSRSYSGTSHCVFNVTCQAIQMRD